MIDADSLDRINAVLSSLPGVEGFALVLSYGDRAEVALNHIDPDNASNVILSVADEYRRALAETPPIRLN